MLMYQIPRPFWHLDVILVLGAMILLLLYRISSGDHSVTFAHTNQSSAIFSAVIYGETTPNKAEIISEVIFNSNGSGSYSNAVRVNAIEQAMAMRCLSEAISSNLTQLGKMPETGAPHNLASAAIAVLGSFSTKPMCHFSSRDGILTPHHIPPSLHDTLSAAVQNDNEGSFISSIYALANARHHTSIDILADLSQHESVPVQMGVVRALVNIPKASPVQRRTSSISETRSIA